MLERWRATVLEALSRYRSSLALDQGELARDPRNAANRSALAFDLARIGDMLARLGHPGEALDSYRRSLAIRRKDWQADSTNLFKRFQVLEGQMGVCRATANLTHAAAEGECGRAAALLRGTQLAPSNAGYRGYLAGAYSDLALVYDSLAARAAAGDRYRRRVTALELYRESSGIWSDLQARGLVNPTDTGRVSAARTAAARAEQAVGRAP